MPRLWQRGATSFMLADILQHLRYGTYIPYHNNGHISTNIQRQKLSIAASEFVCCNEPAQQAQGSPSQT